MGKEGGNLLIWLIKILKCVSLLTLSIRMGAVWSNDMFTPTVWNKLVIDLLRERWELLKLDLRWVQHYSNLTGHDCRVFGHGICNKLFDGITKEPLPRTSEVSWPNWHEVVSVRGRRQTLKNVLQGDGQLPCTSWPLQHAICQFLCPGFV